jgi:heat shock protein HslJ
MRYHSRLALVALGLGCGDSAAPAAVSSKAAEPDPGAVIYKALGNEPFWHVDVRANELQLFEMADLRVIAPKYTLEERADGREYKSAELRLSISYAPCSDGMSDRKYPHTARVEYAKGSFTGCSWPAGYDLGPAP